MSIAQPELERQITEHLRALSRAIKDQAPVDVLIDINRRLAALIERRRVRQ